MPEEPQDEAQTQRRPSRRALIAIAIGPLTAAALFATFTLAHGSDAPKLISETSSTRVEGPAYSVPAGFEGATTLQIDTGGTCIEEVY